MRNNIYNGQTISEEARNLYINGKTRYMGALVVHNGLAHTRIGGKEVTVRVSEGTGLDEIRAKLFEKHDKITGYASKPRATRTSVRRIDNTGKCVASGYVNGKKVEIEFTGTVEGDLGSVGAKPWLKDVREMLVKKYEILEKAEESKVNKEFVEKCMRSFISGSNAMDEPYVIVKGEHIYLATRAYPTAPLEYRDKKKLMKEIDAAYDDKRTEEELWFTKFR